MKYSEVIKDIMQKNNLSQTDLASMLNVNQTTISQWVLGKKKPNYDSILAIYKTFGISPNELFGDENK